MKGAIACGNRYPAEAAQEIFSLGGTAVDALIAAALASGVTEAALTSLGGGGFAILYQAEENRVFLYDFFVDTPGKGLQKPPAKLDFRTVTVKFPGSSQDFHIGLASVAVPGTLKGLCEIQNRHGRLPLKEIVAPAVHFAREGFEVDEFQAYCFRLLAPIFSAEEEIRSIFFPEGKPPEPGTVLRNPDLALFLEALPESLEAFYQGEIAAELDRLMREGGGLLTREDLASYEVFSRKPLSYSFRDAKLLTNPPPAFGGPMVALSLKLFDEYFDKGEFLSPAHIHALAKTLVTVHELREKVVREDPFRALELLSRPRVSRGTTHLSVVDAQGNLAALTMTFGEASGFLAPKTGIVLNNIMGEDDLHPRGFFADPPGKRISSMMAPSLCFTPEEGIALGSGGSKRIRSAIFEVLANLVWFHLPPEAAVSAPRLHFDGEVLQVEPGVPKESLEGLDVPVNVWSVKDLYFGGVHLVTSRLEGAGDARRAGVFRVF